MNYNPSSNGCVKGQLLSMRIAGSAAGDKAVSLSWSLPAALPRARGRYGEGTLPYETGGRKKGRPANSGWRGCSGKGKGPFSGPYNPSN